MKMEKKMDEMELGFSALTEADLGACADVFVAAFGAAPWDEPWTWEQARARLAGALGPPALEF